MIVLSQDDPSDGFARYPSGKYGFEPLPPWISGVAAFPTLYLGWLQEPTLHMICGIICGKESVCRNFASEYTLYGISRIPRALVPGSGGS